jgi:hypothetical protein
MFLNLVSDSSEESAKTQVTGPIAVTKDSSARFMRPGRRL